MTDHPKPSDQEIDGQPAPETQPGQPPSTPGEGDGDPPGADQED